MKIRSILFLIISHSFSIAHAVEFHCETVKKYSSLGEEADENLKKYKYQSRIKEDGKKVTFSRCSVETGKGLTCDDYVVDKVEKDVNVGHKKYYYFRGQVDLQIFQDLSAIENNGRGQVSYQKCKVVSP